ncbi:uncharacterized protein LOC124440782 [Xenia sp. Carnegie-2017]|uniref:uncharacterized protein LOC124440782 n=1 Tax=Xenia sp. Carnegie-2017 TaxID=2897299 RepID=UPI001F040393|nr:uncharacterized protein LOC124440782 [Xenia sp. Carnegie-2017]
MLFTLCNLIFSFIYFSAGTTSETIHFVNVEPDQLYCNQKLHNGESAYYSLANLKANSDYEVRISYPAVMPTKFILKQINSTTSTGRKLLNIEKTVFNSGFNEKTYFEVTAIYTGVPVMASLMEVPVLYDIIVEQLYGGFPINVWKMVFIAILAVCAVFKVCHKPFMNYIIDETQKVA